MRIENRNSRRGILLLAVLLFALFSVSAGGASPVSTLLPGLDEESMKKLLAGQSLILDARANRDSTLLPRTPSGERMRAESRTTGAPWILESAYLAQGTGSAARLDVYNTLTAFETMSGITYFSFNRNRETVLYSDVFRTDAPGSRKRLPDTILTSLPSRTTYDLHIKDVNFGSTWYRIEFESLENGIELVMTNSQNINLLVLRVFEKGDLDMRFAFTTVDEGILIYGVCMAKANPQAERLVDMFSAIEKRIDAVRGWMAGRLAGLSR